MDNFQLGAHLRGDLELDRENLGKAFEAYKLAPDFPGSGRRIAQIQEEAKADPREIVQAFVDAYQSGDLAALPWVIERLEELAAPQSEIAPYRAELDRLLSEGNAYILGSIARTQLFRGDFEDGLRNLAKAILAGESQSKTTLAILLTNPDTEPKILKNLKKKKYFDLPNWPVTPEIDLHTKKGFSTDAIKFIESLLEQGEEQKFYSANRTRLLLNVVTKPASWTISHLNEITSNPENWSDYWDDPEYLFFLGREAVLRDTTVDLDQLLLRLSQLGVYDLASVIYEEFRVELISQILFGDDEEWGSDYVASPLPSKVEVSPLIDARKYFAENLQIHDLLQIIESGQLLRYSESADDLLKSALAGDSESFLPSAQVIEFAARRAKDNGNFMTFSFMLQSIRFSELLGGNSGEAIPFLEYLADYLVGIKFELFERHLFEIYYSDGISKKTKTLISKHYGKYIDFWESARSIDKYADEIIAGNFSNLKSYEEVIRHSYPDYLDFDSDIFNSDDMWYVGVHEAIDLALEKGKGLNNRKFIEFVISIGELDAHLSCKLLYEDLWHSEDIHGVEAFNRKNNWMLTENDLDKILANGMCDEQECLGSVGLVASHPSASKDMLGRIFTQLSEISNSGHAEWALGHNPNTPVSILKQLASGCSQHWEMYDLVLSYVSPLPEFGENSRHVQSYTAWAVADNQSSPPEVLDYLRNLRADAPEWLSERHDPVTAADVVAAIKKRAMR